MYDTLENRVWFKWGTQKKKKETYMDLSWLMICIDSNKPIISWNILSQKCF